MVIFCDECIIKGKYVVATRRRVNIDYCDNHFHCTDAEDT